MSECLKLADCSRSCPPRTGPEETFDALRSGRSPPVLEREITPLCASGTTRDR